MKLIGPILVLALAGALFAAGCGGDDDDGGGTGTATPSVPTTTGGGPTQPAATQAQQSSGQGKVPDDACALVTADDARKLESTIGDAKALPAESGGGSKRVSCRWEWAGGLNTLIVSVSSLPASVGADAVKLSLRTEAKENGREISGLGDLAVVTSVLPISAEVKVLTNNLLVDLEVNANGGREKQEALIVLARAVVARIGK